MLDTSLLPWSTFPCRKKNNNSKTGELQLDKPIVNNQAQKIKKVRRLVRKIELCTGCVIMEHKLIKGGYFSYEETT